MVLSKILVLLKNAYNASNTTTSATTNNFTKNNTSSNTNSSNNKLRIKQVVGIHIDYANRPESGRECDYVRTWCEQLGIVFRVRVINEVTRGEW